jgi:putative Ca2+/H+ antiporter (TMEM165/GDT1 family)
VAASDPELPSKISYRCLELSPLPATVPLQLLPRHLTIKYSSAPRHIRWADSECVMQVGSIIFLAEWGDRSMLATVALGASHPPLGEALLSQPLALLQQTSSHGFMQGKNIREEHCRASMQA